MNSYVQPLLLPLTFPSVSYLQDSPDGVSQVYESRILLNVSCASAQSSCLSTWSNAGEPSGDANDLEDKVVFRGAVMGCKDGTLYVFHGTPAVSCPQSRKSSRPTSLYPSLSPDTPERPLTPASSHVPFSVTIRPRAVSGINTESIEAPKNYVDFEEEADKLKGMLRGQQTKERTTHGKFPFIHHLAAAEKTPKPTSSNPASQPGRIRSPTSLLSATNTPPFTPRSLSRPSSPAITTSTEWYCEPHPFVLRCHIIPPLAGQHGCSITALQPLERNRYMAALNEKG